MLVPTLPVNRRHLWALSLLAVLTVTPFLPALTGPWRLAGFDLLNNYYPWKSFLVSEVRSGRLPLWNPYTFSGCPFVGNPLPGVFYPLDLPVLVLPLERFFACYYALHCFLGAAAMYAWVFRSTGCSRAGVVAGLGWSWCGYISTNIFWGFITGLTSVAVYLPLGMLCLDIWFERPGRRAFAGLAAVLGVQILAGHPQPVMYTDYLLFGYAGYLAVRAYRERRFSAKRCLLSLALVPGAALAAVLLAALLVFPAVETLRESAVRHGGVSYEYAAHDSVPPAHLLTLLAPFIYGDPLKGEYWLSTTGYQEIGLYPGILVIILAAFAAKRRPLRWYLVAATGVSLLAALGYHAPLFQLLYTIAPGFRWFRVPGRLLVIFNFGLAALAGLGTADLLQQEKRQLPSGARCVLAVIMCLVALIALWAWWGSEDMTDRLLTFEMSRAAPEVSSFGNLPPNVRASMLETVVHRLDVIRMETLKALLWTALAFLLLLAWKRGIPGAALAAGGLLLVAADLGGFHWHLIPYQSAAEYARTAFSVSPTVEFLRSDPDRFRILIADDAIGWMTRERHPEIYPERLTVREIETVRGYNPTILRHYAAYINRMQGWPEDKWVGGLLFLPDPNRMDRRMLDQLNAKYLLTYGPAPMNFTPVLEDRGLRVYRNERACPRAYTVAGDPPEIRAATIEEYRPNRVLLSAKLDSPGKVVLAETWFSGWKVKVNGEARPVERYEGIFRAVTLPAGEYRIDFVYVPGSFRAGATVSAVSVLLLAVLLCKRGRARVTRSVR